MKQGLIAGMLALALAFAACSQIDSLTGSNTLPTCGDAAALESTNNVIRKFLTQDVPSSFRPALQKALTFSWTLVEKGTLSADGNERDCAGRLTLSLPTAVETEAKLDGFDLAKPADLTYEFKQLDHPTQQGSYLVQVSTDPLQDVHDGLITLAAVADLPTCDSADAVSAVISDVEKSAVQVAENIKVLPYFYTFSMQQPKQISVDASDGRSCGGTVITQPTQLMNDVMQKNAADMQSDPEFTPGFIQGETNAALRQTSDSVKDTISNLNGQPVMEIQSMPAYFDRFDPDPLCLQVKIAANLGQWSGPVCVNSDGRQVGGGAQ